MAWCAWCGVHVWCACVFFPSVFFSSVVGAIGAIGVKTNTSVSKVPPSMCNTHRYPGLCIGLCVDNVCMDNVCIKHMLPSYAPA